MFSIVGGSPTALPQKKVNKTGGIQQKNVKIRRNKIIGRDPDGDSLSEPVPVIRRTNDEVIPNAQPIRRFNP